MATNSTATDEPFSRYDIYQVVQLFIIDIDVYLTTKGTQETLQNDLATWFQNSSSFGPGGTYAASGWSVGWGPTVWKQAPSDASSGPDICWFVAKCSQSQPFLNLGGTYTPNVIAIGGTSEYSNYAIYTKDGDVDRVVKFTDWVDSWKSDNITDPSDYIDKDPPQDEHKVYITAEAAVGLYALLTGARGQQLLSYLQTLGKEDLAIFSGNSLGGALSPALALALAYGKLLPNIGKIVTWSTAGASPGNLKFANLFKKLLPRVTAGSGEPNYANWNTNFG